MKPTLKDYLSDIGSEIIRATKEKFTGKLELILHMRDGGIGEVNCVLKKNLKKNLLNSAKKADLKK